MMNRTKCLEALARRLTDDEIVVATYSTASEWVEMSDRALNYYSFGAMGLASSHGLGLALGRPERRVLVLDGDGSLLMNLGTLVTIGAAQPKNLVHFVWCNGSYEANGGHPLPNQQVDFCAMAKAGGIRNVRRIDKLEDFEAQLPAILTEEGPVFVEMAIEQGPLGPRKYDDMYKEARRQRMREALGA
jgi:thiamine pyrophosphate-dependent acetolactate synthase large subunit-like protein